MVGIPTLAYFIIPSRASNAVHHPAQVHLDPATKKRLQTEN
jgi:hypothetical protein